MRNLGITKIVILLVILSSCKGNIIHSDKPVLELEILNNEFIPCKLKKREIVNEKNLNAALNVIDYKLTNHDTIPYYIHPVTSNPELKYITALYTFRLGVVFKDKQKDTLKVSYRVKRSENLDYPNSPNNDSFHDTWTPYIFQSRLMLKSTFLTVIANRSNILHIL